MQDIGWNITNGFGEPTSKNSKKHIVDPSDRNKTLCGTEIPRHADEGDGWEECKRCAKKAEGLEG